MRNHLFSPIQSAPGDTFRIADGTLPPPHVYREVSCVSDFTWRCFDIAACGGLLIPSSLHKQRTLVLPTRIRETVFGFDYMLGRHNIDRRPSNPADRKNVALR